MSRNHKTYLVTGGAGFIGSHLIENLIKDKHNVVIIDDLSSGYEKNIPSNLTESLIKKKIQDIKIDELNLSHETLKVTFNNETRILWIGPNNWLLTSRNKELLKDIPQTFKETDFAITDLSHSRAIIELEGENSKEVLKKGCPFNFNELTKNSCINTVFNGITITIDMKEDSPNKIRLFALRSFGESFHHSITDACLEFGYKNI